MEELSLVGVWPRNERASSCHLTRCISKVQVEYRTTRSNDSDNLGSTSVLQCSVRPSRSGWVACVLEVRDVRTKHCHWCWQTPNCSRSLRRLALLRTSLFTGEELRSVTLRFTHCHASMSDIHLTVSPLLCSSSSSRLLLFSTLLRISGDARVVRLLRSNTEQQLGAATANSRCIK